MKLTPETSQILKRLKGGLWVIALISAVLNILLLGGSFYLMLVYDSVLPSRSIPTLMGLLLLVIIVYIFQAGFETLRTKLLADLAQNVMQTLRPRVQQAIRFMAIKRAAPAGGDGLTPLRDMDQLRSFLSSAAPTALMDLPWLLFFLIVLTLLHPWLGATAFIGIIILSAIAFLSASKAKEPTLQVSQIAGQRQSGAAIMQRHAEVIKALGMNGAMTARWHELDDQWSGAQDQLANSTSTIGGISRVFRLLLQSLVLTVGALLVIDGEATGGIIFASSIIAGRALAPLDQIVAHWRSFAAARQSMERLQNILMQIPEELPKGLTLPAPTQSLTAEALFIAPPGSRDPIVQNVSFELKAGDALGIIGMSGSGKTTLLRCLLGLWQPLRGAVRLDNADLEQWESDQLGRSMGYVPQTVELLSGTVAQNIARFDAEVDSELVLAAADACGATDFIKQLPQGFETDVGAGGENLSAGQRQWISMARALYGNPFLLILDEANSNLDDAGQAGLLKAVNSVRARQGIVIMVAHRQAIMKHMSHLMVMANGRIEKYGTSDDLLRKKMPANNLVTSKIRSTKSDTGRNTPIVAAGSVQK